MENKHGGVWSKLYRKQVLIDNDIKFPENLFYEDNYYIPILCLYIERYYVFEEYLYHYFINMKSTTISRNTTHHMDRLQIEMLKLRKYIDLEVYPIYKNEIEFLFVKSYYIRTLQYLFTRYDKLPTEYFPIIQNNLIRLFPNYKNNVYIINDLSKLDKELLRTAELDLLAEDWVYIAQEYINAYPNNLELLR